MEARRILIIDDSDIMRRQLVGALRDAGYDCKGIPGVDALPPLLDSFTPDMVLVDLFTPETGGGLRPGLPRDGKEARHVPFVLMSALPEEQLAARARQIGADTYVSKRKGFQAFLSDIDALARQYRPNGAPDGA